MTKHIKTVTHTGPIRFTERLLRLLLNLSPAIYGASAVFLPSAFGPDDVGFLALLFFPELAVIITAFTAVQVPRCRGSKIIVLLVVLAVSPLSLLYVAAKSPWLMPFFWGRMGIAVWTGLKADRKDLDSIFVLVMWTTAAWCAAILPAFLLEGAFPKATSLLQVFATATMLYYALLALVDIYSEKLVRFGLNSSAFIEKKRSRKN